MPSAIRALDIFCGAGGASWGAHLAGAEVVGGIDLDPLASDTFRDNFPDAKWTTPCRAEDVDLASLADAIGDIDLLIASPECTNHTHARGNRRPNEKSKETALQVIRFAEFLKPRWIVIENVVNMTRWWRYRAFIRHLEELGYGVLEQKLNAADFGVPQSRRRLFILCQLGNQPSPVLVPSANSRTPASSVLYLNGTYPMSPLENGRRAERTIKSADKARKALGHGIAHLVVYYGSDAAGGWQKLDVPLRTVTTLDRFALVKWEYGQRWIRMLQVPELANAMGFVPDSEQRKFVLNHGTRRDKIRLLGNAVCPPVMETVVRSLCVRRVNGSRPD